MNKSIEVRCDDVLQMTMESIHQKCEMGNKLPFWHFMEADKIFEEYNYPQILAVCSEGIRLCPEWTAYIKKNIHRYKIELHCSKHYRYTGFSKKELYNDLKEAKEEIEDTFGQKITTWYVPFGRKGKTEYGDEVCKELGIKYDMPTRKIGGKEWIYSYKKEGKPPFFHINYHFWCRSQREVIREVLWNICSQKK